MAASTDILVADDGGVRTITWNRPDALNAMSIELWDGTRDAVRSAAADDVRCIVFTGTGRGFTVGQDLGEIGDPRQGEDGRGFRGLMAALVATEVPMIAAVNGLAVGFGTTLLPWCDIAIAAGSARFRVPFVSLGVTTEAGSSATLPAIMGRAGRRPLRPHRRLALGRRRTRLRARVRGGARRPVARYRAARWRRSSRRSPPDRCAPPPGCSAPGARRHGPPRSRASTSSSPGWPGARRTWRRSRRSSRGLRRPRGDPLSGRTARRR